MASCTVRRVHRFRLEPTAEQEQRLRQFAGARRFIWNCALEQRRDYYRQTGRTLPACELSARLTALNDEPEGAWLREIVWPRVVVGHRGTFHITFVKPSATPAPVEVKVRDVENTLNIDTGSLAPGIVPARGRAGQVTVEVMPKVQGPVGEGHTYPLEFRFRPPIRVDTITPDVVARAAFT